MRMIEFTFACPCIERWPVRVPKPGMLGSILNIDCPHCESQFVVKLRPNKDKDKGKQFELKILKSLASDKLTRTLQLRAMMKLKSPARWKEEIK